MHSHTYDLRVRATMCSVLHDETSCQPSTLTQILTLRRIALQTHTQTRRALKREGIGSANCHHLARRRYQRDWLLTHLFSSEKSTFLTPPTSHVMRRDDVVRALMKTRSLLNVITPLWFSWWHPKQVPSKQNVDAILLTRFHLLQSQIS